MANANPRVSVDNMMMQMRKCCNHPFLFEAPIDADGDWAIDERVLAASGKMQLLDRMLTVLKTRGHKVRYSAPDAASANVPCIGVFA